MLSIEDKGRLWKALQIVNVERNCVHNAVKDAIKVSVDNVARDGSWRYQKK